jgi:hypothetical protein
MLQQRNFSKPCAGRKDEVDSGMRGDEFPAGGPDLLGFDIEGLPGLDEVVLMKTSVFRDVGGDF